MTTPTKLYGDRAPNDAHYVVLSFSGNLDSERQLTAGCGLALSDGGANACATLTLESPGTLNEGTANVAACPHTHAVAAASAPTGASLLKSDSSGYLRLAGLGVGAEPDAADRITLADGGQVGISGSPLLEFSSASGQLDVTACNVRIGDPAGGDYAEFESDGTVVLTGSAITWEVQNVGGAALGTPADSPGLVAWGLTLVQVYGFDDSSAESLHGAFEMPHRYKFGTDIYPNIHWAPAAGTSGSVVWRLDWVIPHTDEAAATGNETIVASHPGTALYEQKTNFSPIAGSNLDELGHQVLFRIHRSATSGSDTMSGDALLLTVGIDYQVDSLGSRTRTTK